VLEDQLPDELHPPGRRNGAPLGAVVGVVVVVETDDADGDLAMVPGHGHGADDGRRAAAGQAAVR
jgi:hypothetical protein